MQFLKKVVKWLRSLVSWFTHLRPKTTTSVWRTPAPRLDPKLLPIGIFGPPYRAGRRNIARAVRRQTKQGRTISETCRIIHNAHLLRSGGQ